MASNAARDFAGRLDARLALAVVAEAPRLQNRGRADLGDGRGKVIGAGDRRKARDRYAQRCDEVLFPVAILCRFKRLEAGPYRAHTLDSGGGFHRHVLEFVGDDVRRLREFCDLLKILVGADRRRHRDVGSGSWQVAIDAALETELRGGSGEHAAELSGTENANGRARLKRLHQRRASRILGLFGDLGGARRPVRFDALQKLGVGNGEDLRGK